MAVIGTSATDEVLRQYIEYKRTKPLGTGPEEYTYKYFLPYAQEALGQYGPANVIKAISMTGSLGPLSTVSERLAHYEREDHTAAQWYQASHGPEIRSAGDAFAQDLTGKFLICERCGECYDNGFQRLLRRPTKEEIANSSMSMSYVYCPRNVDNICEITASHMWKAQCLAIRLAEEAATEQPSTLFDRLHPQLTSRAILEKVPLSPEDQIEKFYQSLRVAWHWTVFQSQNYTRASDEDVMPAHLPKALAQLNESLEGGLVMWGDVRTDAIICEMGLIYPRAMEYMYQLDPASINYMLANGGWDMEIKWLNDYAGLRRYMSKDQFGHVKRSIQRADVAMNRLVQASANPTSLAFASNERDARLRFREVHSSMRTSLDLLLANRRATDKVTPKSQNYHTRPNTSTFGASMRGMPRTQTQAQATRAPQTSSAQVAPGQSSQYVASFNPHVPLAY
jgi:hypothetical protein